METREWTCPLSERNRLRNGLQKCENPRKKFIITSLNYNNATRRGQQRVERKCTTPRCILAQHYTLRVLGTTRAEGAQAVRAGRGTSGYDRGDGTGFGEVRRNYNKIKRSSFFCGDYVKTDFYSVTVEDYHSLTLIMRSMSNWCILL